MGRGMDMNVEPQVKQGVELLAEDVLLAHKIATDVKAALEGKHPSIWQLVATIFHLGNPNGY